MPQDCPKSAQGPLKTGPRGPQTCQKLPRRPKRTPDRPQRLPRQPPEASDGPKAPQDSPKSRQEAPTGVREAPQRPPKGSQDAPRMPHEGPKIRQYAASQMCPKRPSKRHPGRPNLETRNPKQSFQAKDPTTCKRGHRIASTALGGAPCGAARWPQAHWPAFRRGLRPRTLKGNLAGFL